MPLYRNPNAFPVNISLSEPRTTVIVFPSGWLSSRVPKGGVQEIELDPLLAKDLVKMRMLQLKSSPSARILTPAEPEVIVIPVSETVPVEVVASQCVDASNVAIEVVEPDSPPAIIPGPGDALELKPLVASPLPKNKVKPSRKVKVVKVAAASAPSARRRFYVPEE